MVAALAVKTFGLVDSTIRGMSTEGNAELKEIQMSLMLVPKTYIFPINRTFFINEKRSEAANQTCVLGIAHNAVECIADIVVPLPKCLVMKETQL